MKALYQLVFITCLIASNLFSQGKSDNDIEEISQEEWNSIVDYVNAEITGISMRDFKNKTKSLGEEDENDFQEFMKSLKTNNSEEPIPFSVISTQLEKNWRVTFKNISTPIETFKRFSPKIFDSLFFKIEHLESFKNLKLIESLEYADLKKEFLPIQQPEIIVQKIERQEPEQAVVLENSNIQRTEKRSSYNYWMIPTLLFLISTIALFVIWRKERNKYNNLMGRMENGYAKRDNVISSLNKNITSSNSEINRLNYELEKTKKVKLTNQSDERKRFNEVEKKSPTIEVVMEPVVKAPKVFYSGKPTTEGKFSPVSSSPLSGQTIYKLFVNEDGLTADFEIELVDQFITREVTNAPDEYLYRVCNQENSNKVFSREIITTKKGLAVLIDGNWVVKEANKATIKFQ